MIPPIRPRRITHSYAPLRQWLKLTGTKRSVFLARLAKQEGVTISRQHLSAMLRQRWGCSLTTALGISRVTGIPVENLVRRPKRKARKQSRKAA